MQERRKRLVLAFVAFATLVAAPRAMAGLPLVDRTVKVVVNGTAAVCRDLLPDQPETCEPIDGRLVAPQLVDAHEQGWVHRALALQRALDDAVPWTEALVPHTHNSSNSSAYGPTVSNLDANQVYSITDQLRLDMRGIEIDLHWVPSLFAEPGDGLQAVVMCHGEPVDLQVAVVHAGCSIDLPFRAGLVELREWLDANPAEVVLLYLETNLDGDPAADAAASDAIAQHLGELVARPPADDPCAAMPMETSRRELRDAGHQVLIVGNCGPGAWGTWVHERSERWDESGLGFGDDYPDPSACEAERAAVGYATNFVRRYEDSTWLSAATGGGGDVTVVDTARMVGCGVNLPGFDQLTPDDPRLAALVWSWAEGEPASAPGSEACAAQGADGRFRARACGDVRAYACIDGAGAWFVTPTAGPWSGGEGGCAAAFPGTSFGVPANGYRNAVLHAAKPPGIAEVWLAYRADPTWQPVSVP